MPSSENEEQGISPWTALLLSLRSSCAEYVEGAHESDIRLREDWKFVPLYDSILCVHRRFIDRK